MDFKTYFFRSYIYNAGKCLDRNCHSALTKMGK